MAWDQIQATVAAEFSDLADLEQLTRTVLRLVLAAVLGGCLGYQRERDGHEAGIRTHMLVASASALFLLVPLQLGMDDDGTSRVLQGLLAGVGFICAGSILKMPEHQRVRGLTTAAGIWMTAAIGVAAGLGREMTAVFSTLLVLAIFLLEKPLEKLGARRPRPGPPG
ncbi:MAG: putative rane protein [Ramlibacter sp.]|nr:putative rane protein [Ramlibacter sp.]